MIRTLLAGAAVAGALTFGGAFGATGLAGAAAPSTPTGGTGVSGAGSGAALSTLCSKLPTIESKINKLEAVVAARLPKAEARENAAKAAGHTKIADFIARRIARVQAREQRLNARLSKWEAKCGSSSTSPAPSASTNTGSSGNSGSSAL